MSSIICGNYTVKMVNNQGFKTEYRKNVLNKIKRNFFNEIATMAKNGATNEEIWQYQISEISRIYRIRKIRKTLKRTNAMLIASFKRILNFNRISSREYHSPTRRKSSDAKRTSSGDSGDSESDQPEPPRSTCLTIPQLQQNSYFLSWQSAPNGCLVFGGGQR